MSANHGLLREVVLPMLALFLSLGGAYLAFEVGTTCGLLVMFGAVPIAFARSFDTKRNATDVVQCDVTGCDGMAVGGEIGEGGDLLLCADHLRGEVTGG